jgi:hypothetical protein
MERYLDCTLPLLENQAEKDATKEAVGKFLEKDGPALQAKLLEYDASQVNYIEHFYRELFTGASFSSYSINPNFVLFPIAGADDCPTAAAKLVCASLHHYAAVKLGKYRPEKSKNTLLDMRQCAWVHASARIPRRGEPDVVSCTIDSSRHIVAMCRGALYKIPVVSTDGATLIVDEDILK